MSTEQENQTSTTPPEVDYEKEARLQNWVPKEEYRGNPDEWVDAKEFVERGKQINPILRANNERLLKELNKTKQQMEELRSATEEFKKFQKEQFTKKEQELKDEISSLREEKKKAISAGDGERVVELDEKIDSLKEEQQAAKKESQENKQESTRVPVAPEFTEWMEKNTWFSSDPGMAQLANYKADVLAKQRPDLQQNPGKFLEELDKILEGVFTPEQLGRQKKSKPRNPVEGATPSASGKAEKHSYENLPSEAKAACDKFVRQKLMTREEYVAMYQWE